MLGCDNDSTNKSATTTEPLQGSIYGMLSYYPYVKPLARLNAGFTTIEAPPGLLIISVFPTH